MKNGNVGHRAWKLVRAALLWARKGEVFKRKLVMDLRLLQKYLKQLSHTTPPPKIYYCERQFSFNNTPLFHFNMHRLSSMRFRLPHIPCIKPHPDFDYDFDVHIHYNNQKMDGDHQEFEYGFEGNQDMETTEDEADEEGIDMRAEQFIANFYQQMKLQRQMSYLQYDETPNTHTS